MLTALAFWLALAGTEERISGPRVLADVADRLEAAWKRAVTYEEPVWRRAADISDEGDPVLRTLGPRVRSVVLPEAALANRDRRRDTAILRGMVDRFNREQAPLEFHVVEDEFGLHIVPAREAALLDATVKVAFEERTATEHVRALGRAVGQATGIRVDGGSGMMGLGFDGLFVPPRSWTVFRWGAGPMKARAALKDLLRRSAARLSWRLNCQPATPGFQSAFCVLNVGTVESGRQPALR